MRKGTFFKKAAANVRLNPRAICVYPRQGFTLLEIIIVIGILLLLTAGITAISGKLYLSSQLNESTTQIIQTLRIARERAAARVNDVPHGVYFEAIPAGNDKYVLYQGGATYATRVPSYDLVTALDPALSFSSTVDINFTKGTGAVASPATITLNHVNDGPRVITVNAFGVVEQ